MKELKFNNYVHNFTSNNEIIVLFLLLALYVQELISFLINYHITLQDHINVIHSFTLHTYRENQKNEYILCMTI